MRGSRVTAVLCLRSALDLRPHNAAKIVACVFVASALAESVVGQMGKALVDRRRLGPSTRH